MSDESVQRKTREQEKRYHAMLDDIAAQCTHLNELFTRDDWKRLTVDMFRKECLAGDDERLIRYWKSNNFRLVPSLDGSGLVALGSQTQYFPKYVATAYITYLHSYGVDRDVEWSDPNEPPLSAYFDDRRPA